MKPEIELEELEINLRAQQFKKPSKAAKRFYLAGAYLLPLGSFAILLYDFRWTTFFYFVLFNLNASVYYGIARNKDPYQNILGKSYLKVNAQLLEIKKIIRKPVTIRWEAVRELDVRLFETEATLYTGEKLIISMEDLSDENLRLVKQYLTEIKALYSI